MQYILLHKNDPVANIECSQSGIFEHVNGYYNKELMPPSLRNVEDILIHSKFGIWLEQRFFAKNRTNRTRVLNLASCIKTDQLIPKCYALSLTDCYWIKRAEKIDFKPFWEQANLFDNPDNGFISDVLLFGLVNINKEDFRSPDLTAIGLTDKSWRYEDGAYYLYKIGNKEFKYIDTINEHISSLLCDILKIPSVNYSIGKFEDGRYFSKCKCFTDVNTEFVPFSSIAIEKGTIGKKGISKFISDNNLQDAIDKILIHDFILSVTDRDFTNLGFLRDANTLEIKGMAPLYSGGNSLWYDYEKHGIDVLDEAKTFDHSHERQIMMVKNFDGLDFDRLSLFNMQILSIYEKYGVPKNICLEISDKVKERVNKLYNIAHNVPTNTADVSDAPKKHGGFVINGTTGGFGF